MTVKQGVWEIPKGPQKGLKKPFLELTRTGQQRGHRIFMSEALAILDHMNYLKAELEKFVNSAKKYEAGQKPIVETKNIVENNRRGLLVADALPKETVQQATTQQLPQFKF